MPAASTTNPALHDSAFLRAARGEPGPHTPVWFMRQAGRSLPEYLALREGVTMLDSCMRPEMVVEITLQPVRRYGVDAAIFFSDIVLPLKAVGVDLDIVAGVGPVVASPVRTLADVFTRRGVAAVVEVAAVEGLTARVLGRVGGERTLTDLRHIGESLLRVSTEQRLGLVGLLAWLREQVADDKLEVASERTRRLDSDAAAVQLVRRVRQEVDRRFRGGHDLRWRTGRGAGGRLRQRRHPLV